MDSKRKKWTALEEVTDSVIKARDKRKWQVALRRYVLERQLSQQYAPYYGINIDHFREWIALQFTQDLTWENFGKAWQFEHIIPATYFDFDNNQDMRLCWNFINIRLQPLTKDSTFSKTVDILAAKTYFEALFNKTGYLVCQLMLNKIDAIGKNNLISESVLDNFLIKHQKRLEKLLTFNVDEFVRLNQGTALKDIIAERVLLEKFG